MIGSNIPRKNDIPFLAAKEDLGKILPFRTPKSTIQLLKSNKTAKKGYPIISKDDPRKPLPSRVPDSILSKQKEFVNLVRQWKEETEGSSSISKKLLNFSYLRIIAMGEIVVPLLLQELKHSPDHWFVALKAITNADPVVNGASFDQAVNDWLKWGQNQGLID